MAIGLNTTLALLSFAPAPADEEGTVPSLGAATAGLPAAPGLLGAVGGIGELISPLGPVGEVGGGVEELVDSPVPTSHEACEEGVAWQVAAFAETLRHDVASFRMRLAHWEPEARADAVVPPESFNDARPQARRRDN